jgi:hypothetical protein
MRAFSNLNFIDSPYNTSIGYHRGLRENPMIHFLYEIYYQMLHYGNRLHPQQWVLLLAVMLLLGALCLRGFGSRSNY